MTIDFDIERYKVVIISKANWQLDVSIGTFSDIIGFDLNIVGINEYSIRLPNITNSVKGSLVRYPLIDESIVWDSFRRSPYGSI